MDGGAISSLSAGGAVDLVCAVVFAVSVLLGAVRGLSGQAARLAGFVAGLAAVSFSYAPLKQEFFAGSSRSEAVLALAGAVVAGVLAALLVRAAVSRFLRLVVSQPADAILGGVLCAAISAVLLSLALSALSLLPVGSLRDAILSDSVSGRIAAVVSGRTVGFPAGVSK